MGVVAPRAPLLKRLEITTEWALSFLWRDSSFLYCATFTVFIKSAQILVILSCYLVKIVAVEWVIANNDDFIKGREPLVKISRKMETAKIREASRW